MALDPGAGLDRDRAGAGQRLADARPGRAISALTEASETTLAGLSFQRLALDRNLGGRLRRLLEAVEMLEKYLQHHRDRHRQQRADHPFGLGADEQRDDNHQRMD